MVQTKTSPCPRCRENGKDSRGDNLVNFNNGHKHCFACNYHEYPEAAMMLRTKLEETRNAPDQQTSPLLPYDFSKHIPAKAWKWLIQYELGFQYWKEIVGYSEAQQRLIFRIGEPLAFSIGRYVGDNEQIQKRMKWRAFGDPHKHVEIIRTQDNPTAIVLVEDIISAHKVAQLNVAAMPLFGSKLHNPHIYYLTQQELPIIIWLDKDQAQYTPHMAARLQNITGLPVSIITTEKDPKSVSFDEMKGLL